MPPYPSQRRIAFDLTDRKKKLLEAILFFEKALSSGDFHNFAELTRARVELREINKKLDNFAMDYYIKLINNEN